MHKAPKIFIVLPGSYRVAAPSSKCLSGIYCHNACKEVETKRAKKVWYPSWCTIRVSVIRPKLQLIKCCINKWQSGMMGDFCSKYRESRCLGAWVGSWGQTRMSKGSVFRKGSLALILATCRGECAMDR